ncbi:hypothetical protein FB566_0565 [Stackebrandtia endophytica]|uniref:Tetracycline repressor TetR C-terminal domain-containing protein n=1 Tax=Stackebrandtia endophytica TaxID=1496996 RepID=A0A543AR56_9ACTN|nr:TetR/AcrR family transcriptional regulator C-terminal domain-containing protein [Stackebrandtia endophytica]TQL75073.1 hypothetical protein FB566_0565 [Stackebrandtia endophytica]
MSSSHDRSGTPPPSAGRPARFDLADVIRVGRAIGLRDLTVQAVASALDVTPTAVYRLVPGRVGLERLIGEAILADLDLPDDPSMSAAEHLTDFATRLRRFTLARPGSAAYFQHSFPRGASGARLMAVEVAALTARGYAPGAAAGLCGSVASLALGLLSAEDTRLGRAADHDAAQQEAANAFTTIMDDPLLRDAHLTIPTVSADEYFHLVMSSAIAGLVDRLPPQRPLDDLLAENRADLAAREMEN